MVNEKKRDLVNGLLGRCKLSDLIGNPVLSKKVGKMLGQDGSGIVPRGDVSAPVIGEVIADSSRK
jgi:hypothetical protein